ncbi:MAG: hypothetical protein V7K83_09410 [Nostoc sp.]
MIVGFRASTQPSKSAIALCTHKSENLIHIGLNLVGCSALFGGC